MFTIVYLRGVSVPKLIKSGPRSCWMTSQSMKKSVFFCWDTRPQSCFGVGIEWWNPIGLAIIHFSGIILCPRYLSDRIWPSSQAKSRAVGKSENLEGQVEIDCFSKELLKIWRGTEEYEIFQWNRVFFIYFWLNLRERLTPLHPTLLCTRYQSCLWDFHINLTEKNVNRFEQFCLQDSKSWPKLSP